MYIRYIFCDISEFYSVVLAEKIFKNHITKKLFFFAFLPFSKFHKHICKQHFIVTNYAGLESGNFLKKYKAAPRKVKNVQMCFWRNNFSREAYFISKTKV